MVNATLLEPLAVLSIRNNRDVLTDPIAPENIINTVC